MKKKKLPLVLVLVAILLAVSVLIISARDQAQVVETDHCERPIDFAIRYMCANNLFDEEQPDGPRSMSAKLPGEVDESANAFSSPVPWEDHSAYYFELAQSRIADPATPAGDYPLYDSWDARFHDR